MPRGVYERRPEHWEKQVKAMAAVNRGSKHSPEWNAKISASRKGQRKTPEHRKALGDAQRLPDEQLTYGAVHFRMRREHPADHCESADDTCSTKFQYALLHDTPEDHLRRDNYGVFSIHREDYIPLCGSHHGRYDYKRGESD